MAAGKGGEVMDIEIRTLSKRFGDKLIFEDFAVFEKAALWLPGKAGK